MSHQNAKTICTALCGKTVRGSDGEGRAQRDNLQSYLSCPASLAGYERIMFITHLRYGKSTTKAGENDSKPPRGPILDLNP